MYKMLQRSLDVVAHTFNSSTWEAEAGRSLLFWGQPGLQEFQDRLQSYTEKPHLEKQTNKQQQQQQKDVTMKSTM